MTELDPPIMASTALMLGKTMATPLVTLKNKIEQMIFLYELVEIAILLLLRIVMFREKLVKDLVPKRVVVNRNCNE